MRLTRAVTHIHLCDANDAKIAALDAVAAEFMELTQAYVTVFCTEVEPDAYADPRFSSHLSQRWQRVAIQQAAGIARSWRANHQCAQDEFADTLAAWQEDQEEDQEEDQAPGEMPSTWTPWQTPTLRKTVIQANANVALLQPSQDTTFAYWLRLSTLEKR